MARLGKDTSRRGTARHRWAVLGGAWPGWAWRAKVRQCVARQGKDIAAVQCGERHGLVRRSKARRGYRGSRGGAWLGKDNMGFGAGPGMAGLGVAEFGQAWRGSAWISWPGQARCGTPRHGLVRPG